MNQPDHLSGQLEPHRAGEHGSLQPDCLAVCAPGRGLTVELLFERIIIEPKHSSAPTPEVELISDQLYDMLIRAETSPIERLLLLSPHTLFSLENLQQSFDSQVAVLPMIGEGATNWHFPIKPRARDSKIEVFVHSCHPEPGSRAFATLMGTLGRAELLFPAGALPAEALGVLMGLPRRPALPVPHPFRPARRPCTDLVRSAPAGLDSRPPDRSVVSVSSLAHTPS